MMDMLLILGLVSAVAGLCPSPSFVDTTTLPAAPVFPTAMFSGTMPPPVTGVPNGVLQDHYGEIAQIGAYRPPRIVPCAQPLRTACAHLSSGLKNWHDPTTWPGGNIPTSGNVTLPANTRVLVASCSIDPTTVWGQFTIPITSELVFADAPISIKLSAMAVLGKLTIGTPTCRFQNKITIELGPATRAIDDTGLTKGIVVNGTADIHGVEYAPTWTRLAATAAAGSTVIFIQDLVNWEVGQQILITTTELKDARDFNHNEVVVIAKVELTSFPQVAAITLTTPLAYGHYGGPEYQAEVALLSRRIKIQGDAASEPTDTDNNGICNSPSGQGPQSTYPCPDKYLTGFGGHVMVIGSVASGRFEGIELYRMGQTNMLGRYPLHFHLMGNLLGTDRAVFRDNAVHHSFFRCYAVHGTHGVQVSRNVGYDAVGHCYFIEDGIEENNTYTYNLASHIHPLGPIANPSNELNGDSWWAQNLAWYPESPSLVLPSDMSASGFYITNPHNDFIGNAASGGWTGFAMPSLMFPVKLFQTRTDVAPKNRPFRSPFRGNSAHSSGFWFNSAGAFYIGGELRHTNVAADGSRSGPLQYTSGRSATKDTCADPTAGTLTPQASAGCYDVTQMVWLRFEDNKAFLANRGLQNWGDRSELVRFEFHNVNLAMNVFGQVLIDQLLMECRTQPAASIPAWFSGCNTGTASGVAPNYGTCNQRDIQFWTGYQGFQWYDVGQQHILTNSIFRNCPDNWSKCVYNGAAGTCGGVSVFLSLTHSDQFVPQLQQTTNNIQMQNCGKKWAFTTKLSDGGQDTVSGRLQSWVDFDGSVSGLGVRTMLGSAWSGNWWKYNDQCTIPTGTTEFWACPLKAKDSTVSLFFGYNTVADGDAMPSQVGNSVCLNGGQNAAAGTLCPIIGSVTHFGKDAASTSIKLALNGKITGPLIGCSGGWYVKFNTPPNTLIITQFQIAKADTFILAIPYPVGTTFKIAYKGADWCGTDWAVCNHPVTATTSLANVRAGFGDLYYWDSSKGILYMRIVQRASTLGAFPQSQDKPWTSIIDPEVTFTRNDLNIIEVAYQTYLEIDATGTMSSVDPGVPAAFDPTCAAVTDCPADQGWPQTNAGASKVLPCPSGYYGTQLRHCGPTGTWDAVLNDNCKVGNAFCPADNGWELTAPGIAMQHQCACGQAGANTRQCNTNGVWGSAVITCAATPTCTDGIQNGDETAVDCGGSCPKACTYCQTIQCGTHGTCVEGNPPTCTCAAMWTGDRCATPPVDPCASINCGTYGTCSNGACVCTGGYSGSVCSTPPAATCSDGIKNQDEVNIDCGGTKCPACPTYSWFPTSWTACTVTCGGGTQTRTVTCKDNKNTVVDASMCDSAHPLSSQQPCNQDACPVYSWKAGSFGTCSAPCGGGTQTRQVDCISSVGSVVVDASMCDQTTLPAPTQTCGTDPCAAPRWVSGAWTNCSAACGGGTQTRTVSCLKPDNSAATAGSCTDAQPTSSQSCNLVACASYSWKACPTFYPCTAQCNGGGAMVGVQYRDVFCFKDQDLSVVDNSLCNTTEPTSSLSVCNPQKCTGPNWMADANWGPCVQGTDGVWVRTRTFHCHNADGTQALYSVCTAGAGPLPVAILPCSPGTCSDANGCPQVQLGAVFNDCVNGINSCTPQCVASASSLADALGVLGLKAALAAQCAKDLVDSLPAAFKPSSALVDQVAASLSSGQLNVCAALSGSAHLAVSWVALVGALGLAMLL